MNPVEPLGIEGVAARPAQESDLPRIRELMRSARVHPGNLDWKMFTVAVEPNGGVIGCVQVMPHPGGISEIKSAVVDKPWRSKGIASKAAGYIIKHHQGELWGTNFADMNPFYERFGAVEVVDPAAMPSFLKWRKRWVNLFLFLSRSPKRLAVMRLKRATAPDRK